MGLRVKKSYGKPWSKVVGRPLEPSDLNQIGKVLVKTFQEEAKKEFNRRGWSLRAPSKADPTGWGSDQGPQGGPPLQDSFSFRIVRGQVEILSTYYGLPDLLKGIPSRPLRELTQEAAYQRDPARTRPLVVPIQARNGTVLFRVAPERMGEAWVHPGVKRFTFGDKAVRKAQDEILRVMQAHLKRNLLGGDPTR